MKPSVVYVMVVTLIVAGFLVGCGNDSDSSTGDSTYACSYQSRSSQTCNHFDWGGVHGSRNGHHSTQATCPSHPSNTATILRQAERIAHTAVASIRSIKM